MQSIVLWGLSGAALAVVLVWLWARRAPRPSSRNDRYTAEPVVTTAQNQLLQYLQSTFPGQPVLFHVPMGRLVSVRQAADRERARRRLNEQHVDFVVCADNGKPAFAFEVDAYHGEDAETARRDAAIKNRILKSAGIRLVRLKDSVQQLPQPNEFRKRLSLAALPPQPDLPRRSAREELEQRLAARDSDFKQPSRFGESEVLSLSGLMGLGPEGMQPDPDDPWKSSRT